MPYAPMYSGIKDGTVTVTAKVGGCASTTRTLSPGKNWNTTSRIWIREEFFSETPRPARDGESWSAVKKSGVIKMTPYGRSRTRKKYFSVGVPRYTFAGWWPSCAQSGKPVVWGNQYSATSSSIIHYSLDNLPSGAVDMTDYSKDNPPDIERERNSLRSRVVAANVMTYDILTEVAEFKSTAESILSILRSVRNPLGSFIAFRKTLLKNRKLSPAQVQKALERKWMEMRYSIMPMFYSVQDILKLAKERGDVYKTDRAQREFTYTIGAPPDPPLKGVYLYTREEVEVRISAVAKARYDPAELFSRLFDQLGINPFLTAWELIPFSFVVDWFANVGEWVLAQSSNVTDGALQRSMCESIKERRVKRTYLVVNTAYSYSAYYPEINAYHTIGPIDVNVEGVLADEETESYSRNLFVPGDVRLQVDVNLNWKRLLDAWCLSKQPVITGLRNLKRAI